MKSEIQERIATALSNLDSAITAAKRALESLPTRTPDVEKRLDEYSEVVKRQRIQVESLTTSIEAKDWPEVFRQASLIRESSALIQADVCAVLGEIALGDRARTTRTYEA